MSRAHSVAWSLATALTFGCSHEGPLKMSENSPAELVVHGANVVTVEADRTLAQAFAVQAGRFVFVGTDAEARAWVGPRTTVIDAGGRTVLPGLIDAHLHLFGEGYRRMALDLVGTKSLGEVLDQVREAVSRMPAGATWLRGRGWDQNDWSQPAFPSAADLDAVASSVPIALTRIDGHALWVNRRALAAAAIDDQTPDPPGGRIVRDDHGQATGILVDQAMELVRSKLPAWTPSEMREAARRGAKAAVAAGLTSVHEPGLDRAEIAVLEELYRDGELALRVYVMVNPGKTLEHYLEHGPDIGRFDHRLTVRAVKLYADGALGSRGAALLDDYHDDPGNRGLLTMSLEEIDATVRRAARAGLQPCIHAIGDRANRDILDVYQRHHTLLEGMRPRIEHAQIVTNPDDVRRFAPLGVIASMQPTHATSDMPWAERRLGTARLKGAYAWRSLLAAGARLAFGSDAPVESLDPRLGLYAAATRMDGDRRPQGGWQAQERIDIEEAIRGFTTGAAYAAFQEDDLGSIRVGKLADFVVFDRDPRLVPATELTALQLERTFIHGREVYP